MSPSLTDLCSLNSLMGGESVRLFVFIDPFETCIGYTDILNPGTFLNDAVLTPENFGS